MSGGGCWIGCGVPAGPALRASGCRLWRRGCPGGRPQRRACGAIGNRPRARRTADFMAKSAVPVPDQRRRHTRTVKGLPTMTHLDRGNGVFRLVQESSVSRVRPATSDRRASRATWFVISLTGGSSATRISEICARMPLQMRTLYIQSDYHRRITCRFNDLQKSRIDFAREN